MQKDPAPLNVVNDVESSFDAAFTAAPLPSSNIWLNRWAILSVSEDILRIIFYQTADSWVLPSKIEGRGEFITKIDQVKFCVRQAIFLADKLSTDQSIPSELKFTNDMYDKCISLIFSYSDIYAVMIRAFVSHRSGMEEMYSIRESRSLSQKIDVREMQYRSLEFIVERDNSKFSPFSNLAGFFISDGYENSEIVGDHFHGKNFKKLVNSAKIRNGRVKYQFINELGKSLYQLFDHPLELAPSTWKISDGTFEECGSFFNALSTICAYHIISVHNKSLAENLPGGGKESISLIIDHDKLVDRISLISKIAKPLCKSMVEYFTYGNKSHRPDLSLQPIMRLGMNKFIIPCMMTISNDYERNSLSLQTILETKNFNSQSYFFSSSMSSALFDKFKDRFSVHIEKKFSGMEIDAVIFDENSETLLIIELKWMLRPAETAEIVGRRSTVEHGVSQVSRRLDAINLNLSAFCAGLKIDPAKVSMVAGCVLTDGYMGHANAHPSHIAVVPRQIFEIISQETATLREAVMVVMSPLWLPRPGIDYKDRFASYIAKDAIVGVHGIESLTFKYEDQNLPRYIKQAIDDMKEGHTGMW